MPKPIQVKRAGVEPDVAGAAAGLLAGAIIGASTAGKGRRLKGMKWGVAVGTPLGWWLGRDILLEDRDNMAAALMRARGQNERVE